MNKNNNKRERKEFDEKNSLEYVDLKASLQGVTKYLVGNKMFRGIEDALNESVRSDKRFITKIY